MENVTWQMALSGLVAAGIGLKYLWPSLKSTLDASVSRNKVDTETYNLTKDVLQEQRSILVQWAASRKEADQLTDELQEMRAKFSNAQNELGRVVNELGKALDELEKARSELESARKMLADMERRCGSMHSEVEL